MRMVLLFSAIALSLLRTKGDFIEAPRSVNASLNTTVQFHCSAAAFSLQWNVDGTVASSLVIQDRGITYESVSDEPPSGGVVWNSTLFVNATKRNNNTIVYCRMYTNLEGRHVDSDVVYLMIEGSVQEEPIVTSMCQSLSTPVQGPMTSTGHVYSTPSITTTVSPRKTTENSDTKKIAIIVALVLAVLIAVLLSVVAVIVLVVLHQRRKGRLNITGPPATLRLPSRQNSKKEVDEVAMTPLLTPEVQNGETEEENATDFGRCMSHPSMASSIASKQPSFHRSVSEGGNPQGSARFYTSKDENTPEED